MLKFVYSLSMAGVALLSMNSSAFAHGAWIAERWGNLGVIYGHGAGDDAYDPAKVTDVTALDADGHAISVEVKAQTDHVVIVPASEPALVAMVFDNGFWSKSGDKWVNKPKGEVPGATEGGHYIKNNITLLHSHGALPAFPEQSLQIVPLTNPTELKAGDTFKVRVLFDGKPVSGVELGLDYINASDLKSPATDANGEVEVTLRNDGLNVLAVDHTVALAGDPQADEIGYTATLSFVAADHVEE